MESTCIFPARAMRTHCQLFIEYRDALFLMYQCVEFSVASSKIQIYRGSCTNKVLRLHQVPPSPSASAKTSIKYPPIIPVGTPRLVYLCPIWVVTINNKIAQGITWHVPGGTDRSTIGSIVPPPFWRVEWYRLGSNRSSRFLFRVDFFRRTYKPTHTHT